MANQFIVETSARHVHLTDEHLAILFGEGHELHPKKKLSQPGQFACEERVDLVGPKRTITGVSILGPTRPETQIEVALSDARMLGADVPVRESGDIKGSAPVKLIGPKGELEVKEGMIVAKRHVHFDPESAKRFGVQDKQIVNVKIQTPTRSLIFCDVTCRVGPTHGLAMHIDTDEANAAGCKGEVYGELA